MINVLNCLKKEAKEVSFLSPNWEMTSQSGKKLVEVLKDLDRKTEVLSLCPKDLIVISITRRSKNGIKTVAINPQELDAEDIITSASFLKEEVMRKDDLIEVGVDESALNESFEEGHFFMSLQDDCILIPNKGFTSLIGKKVKAGKMPAGLNIARDLYLASLMGMGSTPVTIVTRGNKSTGTLKAVAAFSDQYPFFYQTDMYGMLKSSLEQHFGHMTEENWCVTHQFTSIVWAVSSCYGIKLGVCAQYSQTGYASLQVFPVAIYGDGAVEKIAQGVSRPNTGSAVAADPNCERLIESFAKVWEEEISPLGEALSRAKSLSILSFKDEIEKADQFVTIRKEFNAKKAAKFRTAFKDVPDTPATSYDVLMHVMTAPVLMHRMYSGTYEMVPEIAAAALAVAEMEGVL